ncbi:DEAD/DEAH box helicase [Pedobacter puniceum]|uniref:DEAD/DEAH box helicase n=1 Tax=Pedobacter puniceum TaxID=2666136 RepID=A0A7K0FQ15_9SPHI|nr:DEAD/DEAH box helicase [Pedobacter puniceum]MRX48058.1 DEAD/DEAH box helicase [Pedobacter puniceum]
MASFEKLKLTKQLLIAVSNAGFVQPTELQSKILTRINGGQDVIAVAPEGAGKSTALVLAVLNKLKFTEEIAPRVLVLVPDIESGELLIDAFHTLNRNRNLRIMGLFNGETSLDTHVLELTDGVDIVVATPDRARAAYLKLGLNLNKIQMFILDDADLIIKKGLQLPVVELARGIIKTQHLVFTEVYHPKLQHIVEQFIDIPNLIEIEDLGNEQLDTLEQILYQVPNFKTKLNLLYLLLADKEVFDKVVVFVNSTFNAETAYKNILKSDEQEVIILNHPEFGDTGIQNIQDFKLSPKSRVLIIVGQQEEQLDLSQLPIFIHFDIPEDDSQYLKRVILKSDDQKDHLAITLCTDLELLQIKKLEQKQGKKMQLMDLPDDLYIEKESKKKKEEEEEDDPTRGGAFHEKKAKNLKTHNYSAREKIRLSGKISNKRLD